MDVTRVFGLILAAALVATAAPATALAVDYPWLAGKPVRTLEKAFAPPPGFHRVEQEAKGFGAWLRGLPLLPEGTAVHLWNGELKKNQGAHVAVVDLDVGKQNLQQCADAVIRLRAEYLWAAGLQREIGFHRTDGTWLPWAGHGDRKGFANYLRGVFMYAGTLSLAKELPKIPGESRLAPGDVLIQGGSPGHAVLVLDAAEDAKGSRLVLIGQSFMPAQQFQVLRNPRDPQLSPWFRAAALTEVAGLGTPEWWPFRTADVRRFAEVARVGRVR